MATTFTEFLTEHPEATLADFAWRCARAMDFCIEQRNDPGTAVNLREEPSDYQQGLIDEFRAKLLRVGEMSDDAWQEDESKAIQSATEELNAEWVRSNEQRAIFRSMLRVVEFWMCPGELYGLKLFMLRQLILGIGGGGCPFPDIATATKTRQERMEELEQNIRNHTNGLAQEQKRTAEANRYKQLLLDSVGHPALVELR